MEKISLNSISESVFNVRANETADGTTQRADAVQEGRLLAYEYARKGKDALARAMKLDSTVSDDKKLSNTEYRALNETFQREHLLYAAKVCAASTGAKAPETFEEFKRQSMNYYGDPAFYRVLQGLYQEIITPILPAVYSEAVSMFADVVEVGFGETYALTIGSNDIPIFQDVAWGASRSVPRNRFYDRTYTLNPSPKSAWVTAKWTQLVGNNMDFGRFFANLAAGMYAKTMGMWNEAMTAAASDTNLVPSGLTYVFSGPNWVSAANKVAASNNTTISNLVAIGGIVPLSKVLPANVTGSTNVNMDAAIATLLGADYTRAGYLGEYMAVRLLPLQDVIVPGTQNTSVQTMLPSDKIWMMASSGYKPMTIAYNRDMGMTLELRPERSADFEIGINITTALDSVATFASKAAIITI